MVNLAAGLAVTTTQTGPGAPVTVGDGGGGTNNLTDGVTGTGSGWYGSFNGHVSGGSGIYTFRMAYDLGEPKWVKSSSLYWWNFINFQTTRVWYSTTAISGPWTEVASASCANPNTFTFESILARYWSVTVEHNYTGGFWQNMNGNAGYGLTEITFEQGEAPARAGGIGLIIEYFSSVPSPAADQYGPDALEGVIHDAVKVGWSWYSRYPANAFFTLRQDSIHNSRLLPLRTHVRINYLNPATGHRVVVFTGRITEPDQSGEDVVYSAWNYLAELSLSRTGYRTMYPNKRIGTEIAAVEWAAAKAQTFSLMSHIATGTIEDPLGLDAVTPITTDQRFGVIDVPRLLLMFDLTEIGRANTQNNVTMGITRTQPFTFFFLKNAGTHQAGRALTYPGNIRDFRYVPGYASLRNDLATIGTSTDGGPVEIVKTHEGNAETYGRRQDVFTIKTLAGISGAATELDAQNAVTARAVKEATALSRLLVLDVRPGLVEPFDGWDIEDTMLVDIRRGRTVISTTYRIVGVRGLMDAGGYHPQLIVQLPTSA